MTENDELVFMAPDLQLGTLLKGIPTGSWVAVSERMHKVMAHGTDAQTVLDASRADGEQHPLIVRIPEPTDGMYF